jgi:yecA family protein
MMKRGAPGDVSAFSHALLITRVHGFMTSVVCGPMVMPSEWLPAIFYDPDEVG